MSAASESGKTITAFAPAKINLALHVCGKRADGYHLLDSLVVFADTGDTISVQPSADLTLSITGPFAGQLSEEKNNLALRAANLLRAEGQGAPGATIELEKSLPVASGIGGGSADAAATLRACGQLWNIDPTCLSNTRLAAELGADVPVCLFGESVFMSGIGEILEPVGPLPDFAMLLVNPGVSVSTKSVFSTLKGYSDPLPRDAFSKLRNIEDLVGALSQTRNDLATPAAELAPQITDVLAALTGAEGCLLSRLSGSGATCFGLFRTLNEAVRAGTQISAQNPGWWARPAALLD